MTHDDRQNRPQTINDLGMQTPRPHQVEAIRACVAGLKRKGSRGQCIMACGTGKTLVGYEVAQGLKAKRVLVLVPSLLLVNQMIREYRAFGAKRILSVCSEDTDSGDDVIRVSVKDLEIDNTTNATAAKEFLEGDGDRIVVSTYQSLRALSEVFGELAFDLAVFDEAHKTAGARSKMFGHGLSDDHVKCARRLFLTATPRHAELKDDGEEAQVYAMNDPKVYGPVLYSLPLRAAIEAEIIDDYRIIVALVDGDVGELGDQAVRVAIDQAMKAYGIRKVFTFHSRVAEAEGFILGATDTLKSARLYHVNGTQSSVERGLKLEGFAAAEAALMTNAQCLTEGVDLPAADMVAFLSRKKSPIGIVQAVGRVLRKHHSKAKGGFVFIPVFVRSGQDEEAAIAESDWRGVYEVLQAMREQDEPLAAALSKCARGEGELPEQLLIMDGRKRGLEGDVVGLSEAMRKAIRVKAMRAFAVDPEGKKRELLKLAQDGRGRPLVKTALGAAFHNYTNRSLSCYDDNFRRLILSVAPSWFVTRRSSEERKTALLELAMAGGVRPNAKTRSGQELCRYCGSGSDCYDATFTGKMKDIVPNWFHNTIDGRKRQREMIFEAATSGKSRMDLSKSMRRLLVNETTKRTDFSKRLISIRPDWFPKQTTYWVDKLLALAASGAERPEKHTPEGVRLRMYVNPSHACYKREVREKLIKLSPNWFVARGACVKNKADLLELARSGSSRPSRKTHLGSALYRYARKSSRMHDADFDREIRRLAPHWFTKKGSEQP